MAKNTTPFEIISHRCLGFGHKENTLRAMQAALASKVDILEIDIRLTKDGKWVVLHNTSVKSEKNMVFKVHEHTYAQLKRDVVRLDVILALFAARRGAKKLMIDVKDVGETRQLVRLIKEYGLADNVIVIAWEPEILRRVAAIDPTMKMGLSYVPIHSAFKGFKGSTAKPLTKHRLILNFNAEHSFTAAASKGLTHHHYLSTLPQMQLYSIQVRAEFCSSKLVELAHKRGWKVYPFVVNTRLGAALYRRRGVDGILTNDPKLFIKEK